MLYEPARHAASYDEATLRRAAAAIAEAQAEWLERMYKMNTPTHDKEVQKLLEAVGAEKSTDQAIYDAMYDVLEMLREAKGNERSERARRFAVTITEMEKVLAYFYMWFFVDDDIIE